MGLLDTLELLRGRPALTAWQLVLSALNGIKSAFVSFTFSASHFSRYKYGAGEGSPEKFQCLILIRVCSSFLFRPFLP